VGVGVGAVGSKIELRCLKVLGIPGHIH